MSKWDEEPAWLVDVQLRSSLYHPKLNDANKHDLLSADCLVKISVIGRGGR
jgi:hypothetical protein